MDRPGRDRVLVVEDDVVVASAFRRYLVQQGYDVMVTETALDALEHLASAPPDVLLSDIGLPDLSGVQLLSIVKDTHPELPVVLVTGTPHVDSAIEAVAHGAVAYLVKPTSANVLLQTVERALALGRLAAARRKSTSLPPSDRNLSNLRLSFERALEGVFIVYQPIVSSSKSDVVGYEALVRTREASFTNPGTLFDAAEQLQRVHDLGRIIRRRAIEPLEKAEGDVRLFVNVHPSDLLDADLYDATSPFAQAADRIVLEITERSQLDSIDDLVARIGRLRALGFQMAIDDIGAGYSGLASFAHVEPQVVKIDMSLVRGVHESPTKQRVLQTLVELCRDLNVETVAEGVETGAESRCCSALGCTWQQGYLFAKPGKAFPTVDWAALGSGT